VRALTGVPVGTRVGARVGGRVGEPVGTRVGKRVGERVGERVGTRVGKRVGAAVKQRAGSTFVIKRSIGAPRPTPHEPHAAKLFSRAIVVPPLGRTQLSGMSRLNWFSCAVPAARVRVLYQWEHPRFALVRRRNSRTISLHAAPTGWSR